MEGNKEEGLKTRTNGMGAESAAGLVRHVLLISCPAATLHLSLLIPIQFRPFLMSPGDLRLL